ncbi:MAG: glycosyltransferase family 2 protein [Candidatus Omnitrophota bacterium]
MKLSVIVPVYNEAKTIAKVIEEIKSVSLEIDREIIVVDDASTDSTKKILAELNDASVKVFFHEVNKGKTEAIKTALKHVNGDFIIIQDADLEYPPSENYRAVLAPLMKGYADVVYGSRFLGVHRVFYFWHYFANKFLTTLTNILFDTMLTDMETGVKAFKKEVFNDLTLTSKRFGFEPEITAKVFKRGYRVFEVPITYCGRNFDEGKKIRPVDGLKAIFSIIKYRFFD